MASGKSTIARHLAGELGWSFFDIDEEIERAEKTTIASIFDSRGEAEFRRIEAAAIAQNVRWIERGHPAVVALGKSTIARHLAGELGWSFFDIDEEIERAEKTTIASIFDSRGEAEFRRIEAAAIAQNVRWIERGHPAVVALGGGAFAEARNRELLLDHGLAVWLDCPLPKKKRTGE